MQEAHKVNVEQDEVVKRILHKIKSGAVDSEKESDYAEHLGDSLVEAFQESKSVIGRWKEYITISPFAF